MKGENAVDRNKVQQRGACVGGWFRHPTDQLEKQLNHKGYI